MKKASEYRQHARECSDLAQRAPPGPERDLLLQMASDWEEMANYRSRLITLHPELAKEGEQEEEDSG